MRGKSPRAAARFAARLSGDSTVAHAVAFARSAEAALGIEPPPRAAALRDLMLALESVANHLRVLASLCPGAAGGRFGLHREMLLRATAVAFGHRMMMDCAVPGGLAGDVAIAGPAPILAALDGLAAEWPSLEAAIGGPDAHRATAIRAGAGRFRAGLAALPSGPVNTAMPPASGEGLADAASHRGPVWHWMRLDGGLIAAAFAADPGWRSWQVLERAAAGLDAAEVPDFLLRSDNAVSPVDL